MTKKDKLNQGLASRIKIAVGLIDDTVEGVAKRVGVARATLFNYMAGTRPPDADTVAKICKLSGQSPQWVLFGTEEGEGVNPSDKVAVRTAAKTILRAYLDEHLLGTLTSVDGVAESIANFYGEIRDRGQAKESAEAD